MPCLPEIKKLVDLYKINYEKERRATIMQKQLALSPSEPRDFIKSCKWHSQAKGLPFSQLHKPLSVPP